MDQQQTHSSQEKIDSINQALQLLNEAADSSADEIRSMIEKDFLKFKYVLSGVKPTINELLSGIQETTVESLMQAKDKVESVTKETASKIDQNAHKNPWLFVAIAAALATFTGYVFASKTRR